MTPEEREAMRERCDKATKGPWVEAYTEFDVWFEVHCNYDCRRPIIVGLDGCCDSNGRVSEADATFIAHSRADLPACLDALEVAERQIRILKNINAERERCDKATNTSAPEEQTDTVSPEDRKATREWIADQRTAELVEVDLLLAMRKCELSMDALDEAEKRNASLEEGYKVMTEHLRNRTKRIAELEARETEILKAARIRADFATKRIAELEAERS